jgi:hypothetical protein
MQPRQRRRREREGNRGYCLSVLSLIVDRHGGFWRLVFKASPMRYDIIRYPQMSRIFWCLSILLFRIYVLDIYPSRNLYDCPMMLNHPSPSSRIYNPPFYTQPPNITVPRHLPSYAPFSSLSSLYPSSHKSPL